MSLEGAQLICLDEDGDRGEIVVAKGRKFTVGCYVSCDCVVTDDRAKGVHCTIECDAFGRIIIRNMSPEHPVVVNGVTVENKCNLFNKSIISILDKRYLWQHSSHSAVEKEATSSKDVLTPKKQIGIPEHTAYSSPGLKTKKGESRFTVHNFAYCIQSDEDGNISVESTENNESSDNMSEEKKSPEKPTRVERHITPEPEITSTACVEGTPKMNLLNCTNNKENTGSTQKKNRLQLSMCHQSEVVITSFSPREAGVRTEKSFTAIQIPKVLVTRAPITPKSVYSTPKSVLGDDDDEIDRSRDINFHTPSTSKKAAGGSTTATKSLKNSSMHLVDFTTPKKLAPASPYLKSALKASAKKLPLTSTTEKMSKNTTAAEDLLGVSALPYTPVVSDDNNGKLQTPNSVQSVISVDSTDTSSVIEILSDESTPGLSTAKTPQKSDTSNAHSTTPMRTPQSLMKRAILTNRNKQVTTPQRGTANVQTTPRREPINRIPLRSSIGASRSPVTQTTTGPDVNTNKRQSISTPSRMSLAASAPLFEKTPTTNTKFATPSPSRRSLMAKSACKVTSTPLGTASYNRYSGCNTTPLNKVRKSFGGVPLSNHISKARKSIIAAAPSNFTSIKEKSPQQKMSDKIVYRARKSVCVTPMVDRAIQMVHAAKNTPSSILKQSKSHRKSMASSRSVLFDDKQHKAQTIDCSLTFILDSEDDESNANESKNNAKGNITKSADDTLRKEGRYPKKDKGSKPKESLTSLEKEEIINLTFSPKKVEETTPGEGTPTTEEIPVDVDEVPQGVNEVSDKGSLESITRQENKRTIEDSENSDDSALKLGQDNDDVIHIPLTSHPTEESFAEEILGTQNDEVIDISESSESVTATEALDFDSGKINTGFGEEPVASLAEDLSEGQHVPQNTFVAIENKGISKMDAVTSNVYHPIYEDITLESSVIEKEVIDLSLLEHSKNVRADEPENNEEVSVIPNENVIEVESMANNENKSILALTKHDNDKYVLLTSTDKENPQHVSHTVLGIDIKDVSVELNNPEEETTRVTADMLKEKEHLPIEESTEAVAEQATTCKLLEEIEDVLNKSDEFNLKHSTELDDNESIPPHKQLENAEELKQKRNLKSEENKNTQETVSDSKHESAIEESISTPTNDKFCQERKLECKKIKINQVSLGSKNETLPKEVVSTSGNEERSQIINLESDNKTKQVDSDSKTKSEIKESLSTNEKPCQESNFKTKGIEDPQTAAKVDNIQALLVTTNETVVKELVSPPANTELYLDTNLECKDSKYTKIESQKIDSANKELNQERGLVSAENKEVYDIQVADNSCSTSPANKSLRQESNLESKESKGPEVASEYDDIQFVSDTENEDENKEPKSTSQTNENLSQESNSEFKENEAKQDASDRKMESEVAELVSTSVAKKDPHQESNLEAKESKGSEDASEYDDIQFVSDTENEDENKEPKSTSQTNEDLSQESNSEFEENEAKQDASDRKIESEVAELVSTSVAKKDPHQESNLEAKETKGPEDASEYDDIQFVSDTENEDENKEPKSTSPTNEDLSQENNSEFEENEAKQDASDRKMESEVAESNLESEESKGPEDASEYDDIQFVSDTENADENKEPISTSQTNEDLTQESNSEFEENKAKQVASDCKKKSAIEDLILASAANKDPRQERNLESEESQDPEVASETDDIKFVSDTEKESETKESISTSHGNELSQETNLEFEEKETKEVTPDSKNKSDMEEVIKTYPANKDLTQDSSLESRESKDLQVASERDDIQYVSDTENKNETKESVLTSHAKDDMSHKISLESDENKQAGSDNKVQIEIEESTPKCVTNEDLNKNSKLECEENNDIQTTLENNVIQAASHERDEIAQEGNLPSEITKENQAASEIDAIHPVAYSKTESNIEESKSLADEDLSMDSNLEPGDQKCIQKENQDVSEKEDIRDVSDYKNPSAFEELVSETNEEPSQIEGGEAKATSAIHPNSESREYDHKLVDSVETVNTPRRKRGRSSVNVDTVGNTKSNLETSVPTAIHTADVINKTVEILTPRRTSRRKSISAQLEVSSLKTPVETLIDADTGSALTPRRSSRKKSIPAEIGDSGRASTALTPRRNTRRASVSVEITSSYTPTITGTKSRRASLSSVSETSLTPKRITRRRSSISMDVDDAVQVVHETKESKDELIGVIFEDIKEDMGAIIEEDEEVAVCKKTSVEETDKRSTMLEATNNEIVLDNNVLNKERDDVKVIIEDNLFKVIGQLVHKGEHFTEDAQTKEPTLGTVKDLIENKKDDDDVASKSNKGVSHEKASVAAVLKNPEQMVTQAVVGLCAVDIANEYVCELTQDEENMAVVVDVSVQDFTEDDKIMHSGNVTLDNTQASVHIFNHAECDVGEVVNVSIQDLTQDDESKCPADREESIKELTEGDNICEVGIEAEIDLTKDEGEQTQSEEAEEDMETLEVSDDDSIYDYGKEVLAPLTPKSQTPVSTGVRKLPKTPKRVQNTSKLGDTRHLVHSQEREEEKHGKLQGLQVTVKTPTSEKLTGVAKDAQPSPSSQETVDDLSGVKAMLTTPKSCATPRFKGMRELMKTPKVSSTPDLGGVKKLLDTPTEVVELTDDIEVESAMTSLGGKTDLRKVKKLISTPKSCVTPRFKGIRELMKTPKVSSTPLLSGVKELLDTPKQDRDVEVTEKDNKPHSSSEPTEAEKDTQVVEDLMETPENCELLNTPRDVPGHTEDIQNETATTSQGGKTDLRKGKKLISTPKSCVTPRFKGIRELMKTPKVSSTPLLSGVKELLDTPTQDRDVEETDKDNKAHSSSEPTEAEKDIQVVEDLMETPENCELLNTPREVPGHTEDIQDETATTPQGGKTDLRKGKKLISTPKSCVTPRFKGIRELMKTPKVSFTPLLSGVKELLHTPTHERGVEETEKDNKEYALATPTAAEKDSQAVEDLMETRENCEPLNTPREVAEHTEDIQAETATMAQGGKIDLRKGKKLISTPKSCVTPRFKGIRELMKTPKVSSTPLLSGVKELLDSPTQERDVEETEKDNKAHSLSEPTEAEKDIQVVEDLMKRPENCALLNTPSEVPGHTEDIQVESATTSQGGKTDLKKGKKLISTPKSCVTPRFKGIRELMKTPKVSSTPLLSGVKELLDTPTHDSDVEETEKDNKAHSSSEPTEAEKDIQVVEDLMETPENCELLNTPRDVPGHTEDIQNETATTSQGGKTDLRKGKKLISTPKSCVTPRLKGIRELMKTPKVSSTPLLSGVKELLDTPTHDRDDKEAEKDNKAHSSSEPTEAETGIQVVEDLMETPENCELLNTPRDVPGHTEDIQNETATTSQGGKTVLRKGKKLISTPKSCVTPRLKGIRELMKTPKVSSTPLLSGVKELLDTPTQDRDVKETEKDNKEYALATPTAAEMDSQAVDDSMETSKNCALLNTPREVAEHTEDIPVETATTSQGGKTDIKKGINMISTPKSCVTPRFKGIRELMKTPKGSSTPLLSGVKELLDTPTHDHDVEETEKDKAHSSSEPTEAEKDIQVVDDLMETAENCELLNTPREVPETADDIEVESAMTSLGGKTDLRKSKKLISTPKSCVTPRFKGIRELMKTPKVSSTPLLSGVKELLDTPTQDHGSQSENIEETNVDNKSAMTSEKDTNCMSDDKDVEPIEAETETIENCELEQTEIETATTSHEELNDLIRVKETNSTPKFCSTPRFKGKREIMETPKVSSTPLLSGVKELLDTPKQKRRIRLEDVEETKKGNENPSPNPDASSTLLLPDKHKELLNTHTPKPGNEKQFVMNQSISEVDYKDCKDVKELMKTPKSSSTPRFKGIRELMKTPKMCSTPVLGGIKELMSTPTQDKGNLDKFLKTPTAKNIMIPTLPSSAVIEKREDSVEMVHSIEYDLNDTHEGGSANLGELFKTPVASRFVDRLSVSYGDDDHGQDCEEVNTFAKEGMVSPDLPSNSKEITSNLQTPSRKVCRRKSLLLKTPLAESPFSAADVLTDLSRTDVEDWVDRIDPLEQTIELNKDDEDDVNRTSKNNKVIVLDDFTANDSLSIVPETCVKAPLTNESTSSEAMINISTNSNTTSKDPLGRSTSGKSKQKNKRPLTPSETADISGIDLLDETAESIFEHTLVVSDDNEDENSVDNNKSLNVTSKQDDTLYEEETDNNLSEPLLLSDDDESEECSKVLSKNENDGKSTSSEPAEAATRGDLSTNTLEQVQIESISSNAPNVEEANFSNKNIRNRESEDIFVNYSVSEDEATIEYETDIGADTKVSEARPSESRLVKSSVEKYTGKVSIPKECEDIFMENSVSETSGSIKDTNYDERDIDAYTDSLQTVATPNDTKGTSDECRSETEDKNVETADTFEKPQDTCDALSKILNENVSLSSQESKHQTSSTSVICLDTTNDGDATQTKIKTPVTDDIIAEVVRVNEPASDLSECLEHKNGRVSEDVISISESTTSEEVVPNDKTDENNEQSSEFENNENNERYGDVISIDDSSCEEVPEDANKEVVQIAAADKEIKDVTTPKKNRDVATPKNTETNSELKSKVNEEVSDAMPLSSEIISESKEEFIGKTTNFSQSSEQTTSVSNDRPSSSQDVISPTIQEIESETPVLTDSPELDLITEGVEPVSENVDNETESAPKHNMNKVVFSEEPKQVKAAESNVDDTSKHELSTNQQEKKTHDIVDIPITENEFETSAVSSSVNFKDAHSLEENSEARNATESSRKNQSFTDKSEMKVNETTKEVDAGPEITDFCGNQTEAVSSQFMSKQDMPSSSEIKGEDTTETTETILLEASGTNEASSCSVYSKAKPEKEKLENQGEAQNIEDISRDLKPEEVEMEDKVSKSDEHTRSNDNMELQDTAKEYAIGVQTGVTSESVIESGKNQTEVTSIDASSEPDNKLSPKITEKRVDRENTPSELNLSSIETTKSSSETQLKKTVSKSETEKEKQFEVFGSVLKNSQPEGVQMESDVKKSFEDNSSKEKCHIMPHSTVKSYDIQVTIRDASASAKAESTGTNITPSESNEPARQDKPTKRTQSRKVSQSSACSNDSDKELPSVRRKRKNAKTEKVTSQPETRNILHTVDEIENSEEEKIPVTVKVAEPEETDPNSNASTPHQESKTVNKKSNIDQNDHEGRAEPESGISNVLLKKYAHQLAENKSDKQTEKSTVDVRKISRRRTSQDNVQEINLKPTKSQRAGNRKVKFAEIKDNADGLDKIDEIDETAKTSPTEIETMQYTEINPTKTSEDQDAIKTTEEREVIKTPSDHVKVKDTEILEVEKTERAKRTRRKPSHVESIPSETSSIHNEAVEIIKEESLVIQAAENTAREVDNTKQSSVTVKVGEPNKRNRRKPSRIEGKTGESTDIEEVIDESVVKSKQPVTEATTPKITETLSCEEVETEVKNLQREVSQETPSLTNSIRRAHSTTEKQCNEISEEQAQDTETSISVHKTESREAVEPTVDPTVQVVDEPKPARRTRRKASIDSAHEDDNNTISRKGSRRKGIEEKKLGVIEELEENKSIDNSERAEEPHERGNLRSRRKASQDSEKEIGSTYTRKGSGRKAHLDEKVVTVLDKIVETENKEHEEGQNTSELTEESKISEAHSDQIALKTVEEDKLPEAAALSPIEIATHDSNESPDTIQKSSHRELSQDSPTGDDKTSVKRKIGRKRFENKRDGEDSTAALIPQEKLKNVNKSKETPDLNESMVKEAEDLSSQSIITTRRNRRKASQDTDQESCTARPRAKHHKVDNTTSDAEAGTVPKIEEDIESDEQDNMNEKQKVAEETMASTEESFGDHKIKDVDHKKGSEHPETSKHTPIAKRIRRRASQDTHQEEDSNNQHSRRCRRIVAEPELPTMKEEVPSSSSRSQTRTIIEEKGVPTKSEKEEEKVETNPEKSESENPKDCEDSKENTNSPIYAQNAPKKCIKRPFSASDTTCASPANEEPVTRRSRHESNTTENEEDINEEVAVVSSEAKKEDNSEPRDKHQVSESSAVDKCGDKPRKAPTRRKAAAANSIEEEHQDKKPIARSRRGQKAHVEIDPGHQVEQSDDQCGHDEKSSLRSRRGRKAHDKDEVINLSDHSEDQHGNDEKSSSRSRRYRKARDPKEPTHDDDNSEDKHSHDEPPTSRSRKAHKANDNEESGTNAAHSEDQHSNDDKLSSKPGRGEHLEDHRSNVEKASSQSQTDIKPQHDEHPKEDDQEKLTSRSRRGRKPGGEEEPVHQEDHDNHVVNETATTSTRRGRKPKNREETDQQDHHTDDQHDHEIKSSVKSARSNKAHEDDKNANQNDQPKDQHGQGEKSSPKSKRGRKVQDAEKSGNKNAHPDEDSKSTKKKVTVTHEESIPAVRRRGATRKKVDHDKALDSNISSGDITHETKDSSKRTNRKKKEEAREESSTTYKEPSDDISSLQSLQADTKSHMQKDSPSNQDVSKPHKSSESHSGHGAKVTHTKQDELITASEDSPSKRGRTVPHRRAATHHSYDETSDSDKPDKRKKKAESPRKSMEAAKSTYLETIVLESSSVPSPTLLSSSVTARGRTRKPTARVQQFLEEERAKAETPKKRAALAAAIETPTKGKPSRRGAKTVDTETKVVGTPQTSKQTRGRAAPRTDENEGHDDEHISPSTAKGRKGSRKAKVDVHAKHSDDAEEPPAKKSPAVLQAEKEKITPSKNEATTPTRVAGRRNAAAAAKFRIEEDALATAAIDPPKKSKAKKQPAKATAISEKRDHRLVSASTVEEDDENPEQLTNPAKEEIKTAIKRGVTRKATSAATETTDSTGVGLPAKKSRKGKGSTETHESDTEPIAVTKPTRSAAASRGGRRNVHFESADQNTESANTEDEQAPTTKKRATRVRRI